MELVNRTPLAAELMVGEADVVGRRRARLLAKATYRFDRNGSVLLDLSAPHPVRFSDEQTDLGLLPRDDLPRPEGRFEVMLLGKAHAPGGRPTEQMDVSLSVDDVTRTMRVVGDRAWQGTPDCHAIDRPKPFVTMPLTWDRAFGGTTTVAVDRDAEVALSHPLNPEGKGFDVAPHADQLAGYLNAPEGYPRWETARPLPNLENPDALIHGWHDAPEPWCWAPTSASAGTAIHHVAAQLPPTELKRLANEPKAAAPLLKAAHFCQCHPAWSVEPPRPGAAVALCGLTPEQRTRFALPRTAVVADVTVGEQIVHLPLSACRLLLLPERRQFSLLFDGQVSYPFVPGQHRCVRLRLTPNPPAC